jgi:hypothetical protein
MSRHKIVKNMDLDDELDDYDGGEDYDDDGGDNGLFFQGCKRLIKLVLTMACSTDLTEDDKGLFLLLLPLLDPTHSLHQHQSAR